MWRGKIKNLVLVLDTLTFEMLVKSSGRDVE